MVDGSKISVSIRNICALRHVLVRSEKFYLHLCKSRLSLLCTFASTFKLGPDLSVSFVDQLIIDRKFAIMVKYWQIFL